MTDVPEIPSDGLMSTVTTDDPPQAYFTSLGQMVHAYSKLENSVQTALQVATNMGLMQAKALVAGMNTAAAVESIKRLATTRQDPAEMQEGLDRAITQFKLISELRNRLVHHGVNLRAGRLVCDDLSFKKELEQVTYFEVTTEMIDAATDDLKRIGTALFHYGTPFGFFALKDTKHSVTGELWLEKLLLSPWKYSRPKVKNLSIKNPPSD